MTKILEFYTCGSCGNVVMITHTGEGELTCCDQPMKLLEEKTADAGKEKHVPVIEKTASGIRVKVGEVPHPMMKEHYIQWISVKKDRNFYIHALRPGEAPEAEFPVQDTNVKSLIYCNVHGLWTNKK
ncbi:MAG: desulfoferrodoxin [Methanomicrobiaceae archaeon]|nr:desulfoferrodoxin [Methanomicrobiaceae archaeon]